MIPTSSTRDVTPACFVTISSPAGKLVAGDEIVTKQAGVTSRVLDVGIKRVAPVSVFNMRVEASSTYYVGKEGLLVHNTNTCVRVIDGKKYLERRLGNGQRELVRVHDSTPVTSPLATRSNTPYETQEIAPAPPYASRDDFFREGIQTGNMGLHATPSRNTRRIDAMGLQATEGGSQRGVSGTVSGMSRFAETSRDKVYYTHDPDSFGYYMDQYESAGVPATGYALSRPTDIARRDRDEEDPYGVPGARLGQNADSHTNGKSIHPSDLFRLSAPESRRVREVRPLHEASYYTDKRAAEWRRADREYAYAAQTGQQGSSDRYPRGIPPQNPYQDEHAFQSQYFEDRGMENLRESFEQFSVRVPKENYDPAKSMARCASAERWSKSLNSWVRWSRSKRDWVRASCFVAGTPVLTPEGEKAIETIEPGDFVMAAGVEGASTAGDKDDAQELPPRDLPLAADKPPQPSVAPAPSL
ncbi:hypothetical protein EON77_09430, partial [bacterium]